ncbi:winged helix-turn-helix domain-containing protein [Arthrobacter sp. Marseille-P9274]|uniref:winged helix-turn-helix domain-containing protein n=1 Tax=Arthrobacter sp. Marseille-P9274 TaxID=2866572 RepID=UPI0021C7C7E3|nr:crosslink repair DNA glycosylase YcaQ family protein [Arthrobacter sp. Marseille-P9274]
MAARIPLSQARRIALAAQLLHQERPTGLATARQVGRTFDRLQLLQIDSVNVLTRAHYLPLFSRLGNYDVGILQRFSGRAPRRMVEYWAHEASYIRPALFADLKVWQKRRWIGSHGLDADVRRDLEERILRALAGSRPLTAREVASRIGHQEDKDAANWGWNWNAVKRVLEVLFEQGDISAAGRNAQFERLYAPTAKVMPKDAGADGPVDKDEAMVRLMDAAARAHGVGTARCLADYFRVPVRAAQDAIRVLVAEGRLEEVSVEGWPGAHYLHPAAARPRQANGRALLGPFDSLVFERERLEKLFGFRYRIEIYTPAEKRQYGYYVLPFLLREQLCARVDLKAHRAAGYLEVRSAFSEAGAPPDTSEELAAELALMGRWLGLGGVQVADRGNLAPALALSVARQDQDSSPGNQSTG